MPRGSANLHSDLLKWLLWVITATCVLWREIIGNKLAVYLTSILKKNHIIIIIISNVSMTHIQFRLLETEGSISAGVKKLKRKFANAERKAADLKLYRQVSLKLCLLSFGDRISDFLRKQSSLVLLSSPSRPQCFKVSTKWLKCVILSFFFHNVLLQKGATYEFRKHLQHYSLFTIMYSHIKQLISHLSQLSSNVISTDAEVQKKPMLPWHHKRKAGITSNFSEMTPCTWVLPSDKLPFASTVINHYCNIHRSTSRRLFHF